MVLMALPSSRFGALMVEPTTTTSSSFWRASLSETSVVTVSAEARVSGRDTAP